MPLANQPKFCWPKVMYYVSLNKLKYTEINEWVCWVDYVNTKYLGKAKMLNKKLPVKRRQIDVRSRFIKLPYVLEGSYDKRFNYKPRFKFCKTKATQETPN